MCAHTVGNVTIIDAIVVPSSAYRFRSLLKLDGDCDVGSAPPEIFARGDLRELRRPADVWESVTVAVGDQSGRHRTGKIVDVLQRLQHPEARPDASVVHDEVELRPIAAGVHEI